MDKHFNWKVARTSSLYTNALFLLIHCCLIVYFIIFQVKFMVYVNMISIPFYILGHFVIKKNHLKLWVWGMALEVIVHMTFATICLGTEYGFHYCLIGMVCIFFYAEYFFLKMNRGGINGTFFGLICAMVFLYLELYAFFEKPVYVINPTVALITRLLMSVIVFFFIILALRVLVAFSFSIEDGLEKKAEYDALTGLPNRYYMSSVFEQIFAEKKLSQYWVAMVDIDDFKKINDTYGHGDGDIVLKDIANILSNCDDDIQVCRWGGEEFLLLGKRVSVKKMKDILDDIRTTISQHRVHIKDGEIGVTVTIGANEYGEGKGLEEWIQLADKKLYVGKYNGKNQVVC